MSLFSLNSNSNHASPGNFISANNSSLPTDLFAYKTLQKSSAAPVSSLVSLVLPLRNPTPPNNLSIYPLIFHKKFAAYHPFEPTILHKSSTAESNDTTSFSRISFYVSSANYIDKMSHYCQTCYYNKKLKTGEKACPFNSFYWNFYSQNQEKLEKNPRIGMAYRTWAKMKTETKTETKTEILKQAEKYLKNIDSL